ncbi:hypothetical protein D9619_003999 [Psilocybe cf. subviscida]|uniref:Uncharacterized protein n=1 Tax=Psilocybe cf. subviscida TaxID=2480587 RepID=A0A8H5F7Z3_9AGAR|nr:hypothetical protein D9619_003999 [Psilocybe cf. subviscida]
MPPNFSWLDAMCFLRAVLPRSGRRGIRHIVRTVEAGEQIFWVGCDSVSDAAALRGIMSGRMITGYPPFIVEFIHGDVWSARASWGRESWTRKTGLTLAPSASSHHRRNYHAQLLLSADFFWLRDPEDARRVAELVAAAPRRATRGRSVASRTLLYQRLEATRPPDDDTILTRRQRRARDSEYWREDRAWSPQYEDSHSQGVQEGTEM